MRINVIGTSGSGKTTFSRQLAEILNIPFIEMDALYWGPNWRPAEEEDFHFRLSEALSKPDWVLDGNYSRTTQLKWKRVEAVIWLDFSFPRTLFQAISRAGQRLRSQQELWPDTGNRESLRMLFSKDSIVLWTITSYRSRKQKIHSWMRDPTYQHIQFHQLRSPQDAAAFLKAVREEPQVLYRDRMI